MLSQAVFLVGGRGTRLGTLTEATPKPLLAVGDRPFLDYLIENAARHGLKRIVLLCGYKARSVAEHYRGRAPFDTEIRIAVEPEPAGTAGALRHAAGLLDEEFLLCNGDSLFDVNWLDLLTMPTPDDWIARLALRAVALGDRYGRVALEGERIRDLLPPGGGHGGPVNAGVYLMRRSVLDRIGKTPCSLEQDVFPRLAAEGLLFGRIYDGFFIDIGIPADFARAQTLVPKRRRRPAVFLGLSSLLGASRAGGGTRRRLAWIDGAREAVKLLNDRGYAVLVIPSREDALADAGAGVTDYRTRMLAQLQMLGAHIDNPDFDLGRSAARDAQHPPILARIVRERPVDLGRSVMIARTAGELEAAAATGIDGRLFEEENLLDFVVPLLS